MRRPGPTERRHGLTLTELIVVVVLIGLLSALVVPRLTTSMGESQLDADCNRLFSDLQWAKTQAPSQSTGMNRSGTRIYVLFDTLHRSWTIYRDNGDSTFDASQDTAIKRDSLAGTSRFGFDASFALPSIAAPLGTGTAPQTGFGQASTALDDCLDGKIYPAPVAAANSWAFAGSGNTGGKIVVCGGATGDMSNGVLFITSKRSGKKAYAIVYNSLSTGTSSHALRRYAWDGTSWSRR
ncbi:MAG: prepilin-type N-terminal cleavage/methylation domain-containing protein [Fibrobacterota bacterium]|nr:prepilin-type N-terminal cleavage/methylation domain-containing protein [Fibrobacterota bacterium]QQS05425.1 MAG: prepilin-type N-terminal cleavage/methylation domain-containing protein [Fibrobacterota bacterium]